MSDCQGVPAYAAVVSPTTFFCFDNEDSLDVDVEQVNRNSYDRLKLCRTTGAIDHAEPRMGNYGIILGYPGVFLIPKFEWMNKELVVDIVNRKILELVFRGLFLDSITHEDVGYAYINTTGYFQLLGEARGKQYNYIMQLQQKDVSSFDSIGLVGLKSVELQVVYEAILFGRDVVNKLGAVNPSIILNGITFYKKKIYSSSLVSIWSSLEMLVSKVFDERVMKDATGTRKRFLGGWSVAYQIEAIFQKGLFSKQLYDTLTAARKARNGSVHKLESFNAASCETTMRAFFQLASLIWTDFSQEDKFDDLVNKIKKNEPQIDKAKLPPHCWRPLLPIPGDTRWGDKPYPQHERIKLQDVQNREDE